MHRSRLLLDAEGHLAGLLSHVAAESMLTAVRFVGESGNNVDGRELRSVPDRTPQFPQTNSARRLRR